MSIADNIKRIREMYGLSQEEFAKIAGVSDKAVSTWETGRNEPRMGAIQKIADYFNITKSEIIDGVTPFYPTNSQKTQRSEVTYAVTTWKREYQEHADDYAKLDDYGREAVDAVTKVELARVKYEQEELERVDYNNIITISKSDFAASAGTGIYLGPESFSQIKVCKNNLTKKAKFAVPVRGNSMNPDFYDGQILLVGEEQPKMGEFGIFTLDGEGYVKMLGDGILIPMNTKYPNIKMNDSIRCNGKVLGVLNPDWIVEE